MSLTYFTVLYKELTLVLLAESFMSRFGKLPCGGIGVDSDTVWNELYTPQAARMVSVLSGHMYQCKIEHTL